MRLHLHKSGTDSAREESSAIKGVNLIMAWKHAPVAIQSLWLEWLQLLRSVLILLEYRVCDDVNASQKKSFPLLAEGFAWSLCYQLY